MSRFTPVAIINGPVSTQMTDFADKQLVGKMTAEVIVVSDPLSDAAQAIRSFQSRIQRQFLNAGVRSFAILGDASQTGASFLAANLAVACAQSGLRTALIDANLADPRQAEIFGIDPMTPGLADWVGSPDVDCARFVVAPAPNLFLMPAGTPSQDESLLQQVKVSAIIRQLGRLFDVVIYDIPPATDLANALAVAAAAERTILVGREHHTLVNTLQQLSSLVQQCRGNVAGIVLTQF